MGIGIWKSGKAGVKCASVSFIAPINKVMKNVISFSLWGNNSYYVDGAFVVLDSAKRYYPNWECWVYVSTDVEAATVDKLKAYGVKVIIKDPPKGKAYKFLPAFWRFLPASDLRVERFVVRDLDSPITHREVAAVNEWERSGKVLHIMRDHPKHEVPIMAGMWGAKASALRDMEKLISKWNNYARYGSDQKFLAHIIYPRFCDDALIHSECTMLYGEKIHPFPERLEDANFIGMAYQDDKYVALQAEYLRQWREEGRPISLRPHMWSLKGKIRIATRGLWPKIIKLPANSESTGRD
jgi:hypothetical protein